MGIIRRLLMGLVGTLFIWMSEDLSLCAEYLLQVAAAGGIWCSVEEAMELSGIKDVRDCRIRESH